MYDELIKRLRRDATAFTGFVERDLKEAADAIENLTRIVSDLSWDETCDPEYRQTHRVGG